MVVKVVDAIMGTGKSSAAINYMNERRDCKFIYITPFLDEVDRVVDGCKELGFVQPVSTDYKTGFSKISHTAELIRQGKNIITTHAAFKMYEQTMLDDIRNKNYTLIIDESISAIDDVKNDICSKEDLDVLINLGYVYEKDNMFFRSDKKYEGIMLSNVLNKIENRPIVKSDLDSGGLYWFLTKDFILSFNEVFMLTYLFEGQGSKYMLDLYQIEYEKIGIEKRETGFYFSETSNYIPPYVKQLGTKIHIERSHRLNQIGDDKYALSSSWMKTSCENGTVGVLKNNVYNYFINSHRDTKSSDRMWSTFISARREVEGKGYTKQFIPLNSRATNKYQNRTVLVYACNLFVNTGHRMFYREHGVTVDDDIYALSTMIQWIWRSAIRNGQDIYIYIPSSRMRTLLINWINSLSDEGSQISLC